MRIFGPFARRFFPILLILALQGCSAAYYKAAESLGFQKRDILVHRVEKARDSQQQAKEQFKDALERFTALTGFRGGNLEQKYKELNGEFEQSQTKANDVHKRIADIEDVSGALFDEWEKELGQYTNPSLRRDSERKLRATRQRYGQLIAAMKRAESKMQPVLAIFHDQVLFLKHNLNAQAIASLKGEVSAIETNVAELIKSMEASIREADQFIKSVNAQG
jgi:predicted  nucleic acid-binding Zn-ribbon protein